MSTDTILKLRIAFANIPMKGLFFWESLLSLKDEEYKKIVEENFINAINNFPKNEKDATTYYQEILTDLRELRKSIQENPDMKSEVEKIKDEIISEIAHEKIVSDMKNNL